MIHRIEVRSRDGAPDPRSADALHEARRAAQSVGVDPAPTAVESATVYLLEADLTTDEVERIASELLADAVTEESAIGAAPARGDALIEVHPRPGVMDPDAEPIEQAIRAMLGRNVEVRTGHRFDFHGTDPDASRAIAERTLANPVIHAVEFEPFHPESFPHGHERSMAVPEVSITTLDDGALETLSREAHLFLSLEEMQTIRDRFVGLKREPREIELETLAQTWSEHCVHKTLKATIRFDGALPSRPGGGERPGHVTNDDGSVTINNLLKCTVAAATHELMHDGVDWCLSVFVDNAGIIAFDDDHAVCFKVETHNHPSAIEPYGGAATGIGGCIRDIIGTGLAAKPIAATDVFCVAGLDGWSRDAEEAGDSGKVLPAGCLHPRRILHQVVAGVRDYGNRMGIPTMSGTVWFDDDYVGNPLVYCGCVGVMPRDRVEGDPRVGDRIIALGGRTGRDGVHGATFSSAELTDTHADEFSHAVQIGNPVTEKKVLDVILHARDHADGCLFRSITDCGAGGFSSAVGEMGEVLGASVELDRAPLKYAGLTPTEIWISEAQERMVLAVPEEHVDTLAALCVAHDVEWCDLGVFGTDDRSLRLHYGGEEIGRLDMHFLHDGLPGTTRDASWTPPSPTATVRGAVRPAVDEALLALLADPNIASKEWIVRQYDHEVQGRSIAKPLVGRSGHGPGDAAIVRPVPSSPRGLSIACGLSTGLRDDPYRMALAAIDECVRNLVCVGTDPECIAILDNFCWPSCGKPQNLGSLVLAAEGCYDGAKAYRTPFISGKDSLNNQFTTDAGKTIEIPPTLLISGFGIVPDESRAVTMDAKRAGNLLLLIGTTTAAMGGSIYASRFGTAHPELPQVDVVAGPRAARAVYDAMTTGCVASAHDCSEGGLLVAASEMAFAGGLGVHLDLLELPARGDMPTEAECFAETPGRYLLEVARDDLDTIDAKLDTVPFAIVGEFNDSSVVTVDGANVEVSIEDLEAAFLSRGM